MPRCILVLHHELEHLHHGVIPWCDSEIHYSTDWNIDTIVSFENTANHVHYRVLRVLPQFVPWCMLQNTPWYELGQELKLHHRAHGVLSHYLITHMVTKNYTKVCFSIYPWCASEQGKQPFSLVQNCRQKQCSWNWFWKCVIQAWRGIHHSFPNMVQESRVLKQCGAALTKIRRRVGACRWLIQISKVI